MIRAKSIPHFEKWIAPEASARSEEYETRLKPRLYKVGGSNRFELPPSAVTRVVHNALTVPSPRPRYRITTPTKVFAFLKRILPTRMLDRILLKV